ncbi:MAG: class I SAM-dependent methyltransferase [Verrucomicrobia bacterium]|nr:class I SAM-dependent methyltransferase [Verrucomicrobiota bacterium]
MGNLALLGFGVAVSPAAVPQFGVVASISGRQINSAMDHCALSVSVFHKHADLYRDKFMGLTMYDGSYRAFCELLRPGRARVLDAACGPGNVSRYLMAQRPDLDLLGIDLAPRMVELAREAVPGAHFAVHDCRRLADLQRRFDGIICAFALPYLSGEEATAFMRAAGQALDPGGALYLSTMLGRSEDSGFERSSTGDQVYINYHSEEQVVGSLQGCGCTLLKQSRLPSPSAGTKRTTDLIVIAKK